MDDIFKRTRMVNKGKKFGSTGHILSGQRQNIFYYFLTIFSHYMGGGCTNSGLNDYPRSITPSQKIMPKVMSLSNFKHQFKSTVTNRWFKSIIKVECVVYA